MSLIIEAGLEKTVCKLGECYEKLVREFLVNIPKDCDNPLVRDYQKVYVRRECVNFSPNIINNFLGVEGGAAEVEAIDNQICKEFMTNKVQVWPKKRKISSGKLSMKYVVLNIIGAANWVPTTHSSDIATGLGRFIYAVGTRTKMDIGRYVFDQTMRHAKSDGVKFPITFPTLLCKIILSQHPDIVSAADLPMKRDSPLTFLQKLFGDSHAPDLVGTSVPTSNAGNMSEKEIIAGLKAISVILGERKTQIDLMILAMERKVPDNAVGETKSEKAAEEADNEKGGEDESDSGEEDENAGNSNEDLIKEGKDEQSGSSSEAEEE